MSSGVTKCPKCGEVYCTALYTLGFIRCTTCGIFFDSKGRELPVNEKGQVIEVRDIDRIRSGIGKGLET